MNLNWADGQGAATNTCREHQDVILCRQLGVVLQAASPEIIRRLGGLEGAKAAGGRCMHTWVWVHWEVGTAVSRSTHQVRSACDIGKAQQPIVMRSSLKAKIDLKLRSFAAEAAAQLSRTGSQSTTHTERQDCTGPREAAQKGSTKRMYHDLQPLISTATRTLYRLGRAFKQHAGRIPRHAEWRNGSSADNDAVFSRARCVTMLLR
jgi:hypothetical protein